MLYSIHNYIYILLLLVLDRDHVLLALDADRNRPITVPQTDRTGSRSPKNRSPKPPRSKDKLKEVDQLKAKRSPKPSPRLSRASPRSPRAAPRSTCASQVPTIEVTLTNGGDLDDDSVYDNVTPNWRQGKHHCYHGNARKFRGLYQNDLASGECGMCIANIYIYIYWNAIKQHGTLMDLPFVSKHLLGMQIQHVFSIDSVVLEMQFFRNVNSCHCWLSFLSGTRNALNFTLILHDIRKS